MVSTYSANYRFELIGTGDQTNTWGVTQNGFIGSLLENALSGYVAISMTSDANYTLSANNGASDESRNKFFKVTSTVSLTATRDLIVPAVESDYVVQNSTSGSQSLRVKTAAGTGITIPNGKTQWVWSDGTNVYDSITNLPSGTTVGGSTIGTVTGPGSSTDGAMVLWNGTTGLVIKDGSVPGTIVTQNANNVSITGGSITGITDLAVADGGTGASDASTARTNLGLGTIATQAANNVSITGGAISGITDLAVADGGTGASDASGARTNLGLGTMATQNANNVAITGGTITGVSGGVPEMLILFDASSGTPSILKSYNVTSITDRGVGLFTVNATSALASAYPVTGCVNCWSSGFNAGIAVVTALDIDGFTGSASAIAITSTSGGTNDRRDTYRVGFIAFAGS